MEPCIQLQGISKKYKIGGSHYRSLRDDLVRGAWWLRGSLFDLAGIPGKGPPPRPILWALKDINVEIQPGERVGFIGPNGAGKTTVLRLMGAITRPTGGRLRVHGRVGALIAVGAGIHPELTGRENIFLYGSIMGLKRREIQGKFDRIVDFSGVGEFLDTPVKYFSSGMRVRLGFSVAVHVDPDILLVDEVLAVGDADFQRQCLEKITSIADAGCTIVFVSHDLNAMLRICNRGVYLNHGQIICDTEAQQAVNQYLDMVREGAVNKAGSAPSGHGARWGTFEATVEQVRILDPENRETDTIESGGPLTLEVHYQSSMPIEMPDFGFDIYRNDGLMIYGTQASFSGFRLPMMNGPVALRLTIDHLELAPGSYRLGVSVCDKLFMTRYDSHDGAYPFKVVSQRQDVGVMQLPMRWEIAAPKMK